MEKTGLFSLSLLLTATAFLWSCDKKEVGDSPIVVQNEQALTQSVFADDTQGKSGVTFGIFPVLSMKVAVAGIRQV